MQGMNFVIGSLLIHLAPRNYQNIKESYGSNVSWSEIEEIVFYIFKFICENKNWREIYKEKTQKCIHLIDYLEKRVELKCPEIMKHLMENDVVISIIFV